MSLFHIWLPHRVRYMSELPGRCINWPPWSHTKEMVSPLTVTQTTKIERQIYEWANIWMSQWAAPGPMQQGHYPTHTQMVSLFTVTYTQKEKSCRKLCCRVDASRDRQKYQSLSHSKKIVKCQLGYSGAICEQIHLGTKDTATWRECKNERTLIYDFGLLCGLCRWIQRNR